MRTLTYTGRADQRRFTESDGVTTDVTFHQGDPLDVSEADADRILAVAGGQFVDSTPTPTPFPHTPRPAKGTPEPKEG